jgi:hypothetical protein
MFYVEENFIYKRDDPLENPGRGHAGCFGAGMESIFPGRGEQMPHKIGLHQEFTAGESDSAAAFLVEWKVLHNDVHNFGDGFPLAFHFKGTDRTFPDAGPAPFAAFRVYAERIAGRNGLTWADTLTVPAPETPGSVPKHLFTNLLAFGIGAPAAVEGTAF